MHQKKSTKKNVETITDVLKDSVNKLKYKPKFCDCLNQASLQNIDYYLENIVTVLDQFEIKLKILSNFVYTVYIVLSLCVALLVLVIRRVVCMQ